MSIVGFWLSVLGIVIAYLQILSVKEIAKVTQEEIKATVTLYNNMLMLTDLSRKAAMVDEIQTFLKDDKIELCILRMKDLKSILNSLRNQEYYGIVLSKREFKVAFGDFNLDLYNLQRYHMNPANKLDRPVILINLEKLSSLFLNIEIKLKTYNHAS